MWIQSLVSCPTHKNTTSLFHQYRYQQQETSPSFISEAPTHLSKGFWTRCGNLAESLLKDPRRYYGKGHSSFERAACSKQQPSGVCSARSCSLRLYFRRAYEKLWTFIVWARSCYRAELLFQASCYIIKQERKKKKKNNTSCLSGSDITECSNCQLIASDSHCKANSQQLSIRTTDCYLLLTYFTLRRQ